MSFTTQPILVPWDFSDMAKDALNQAIELAENPGQMGNFAFLILYLGKEMPQYPELEKAIKGIFQKLLEDK